MLTFRTKRLKVSVYRITYQSEVDRWKDLAIERLAKMEQLNSQLEERHSHEVRSLYFY